MANVPTRLRYTTTHAGRAVIGGLIFATVATLVFAPVVFGMVHSRQQRLAATSPQAPTETLHE